MLSSPRLSFTAEESFIPEENVQAILKLVEEQLKIREFKEEGEGLMLNIEHEQVKWQILVSKKSDQKKHKKIQLKHLDLFVLDHSRVLGEGSQGKVILGQDIASGKLTAVKVQKSNSPSFDTDLKIERRNLALCNRLYACAKEIPADLKLEGLTSDQAEAEIQKAAIHYTAMAYVPGLSLSHFIKNKGFDVMIASKLAVYGIQELSALHAAGLLHRDLKPDNFVVNTAGRIQDVTALKVVDLGTAILQTDKAKEDAGTLGFMPPEYLKNVKDRPNWDKACDVWQLGITLAILLSKEDVPAGIQKFAAAQQDTDQKCHMSEEQIKGLMPDIFGPEAIKVKKEKKSSEPKSREEVEANIQNDLRLLLINTIHKFTNSDRDKRPVDDELKEISRSLFAAYLRAGSLSSLNNPTAALDKYKRMKRQNTVLDLPRSVSFAPTLESILQPSKEEPLPSRPARSSSNAPQKVKRIDAVISPRRRSKANFPEVESLQKELQQLSLKSSLSAEAESLSATFQNLTLEVKSPTEQIIDKLRHVQKSFQLHEAEFAQTDLRQGSVSDYLVFSFLERHLKTAVESSGQTQTRELATLDKITAKFVPSKNTLLNEQVALIRKTLNPSTTGK